MALAMSGADAEATRAWHSDLPGRPASMRDRRPRSAALRLVDAGDRGDRQPARDRRRSFRRARLGLSPRLPDRGGAGRARGLHRGLRAARRGAGRGEGRRRQAGAGLLRGRLSRSGPGWRRRLPEVLVDSPGCAGPQATAPRAALPTPLDAPNTPHARRSRPVRPPNAARASPRRPP